MDKLKTQSIKLHVIALLSSEACVYVYMCINMCSLLKPHCYPVFSRYISISGLAADILNL